MVTVVVVGVNCSYQQRRTEIAREFARSTAHNVCDILIAYILFFNGVSDDT